jgi:N-carbamoyl-L-amino-acid hydrolase
VIALQELNRLSSEEFVAQLTGIFEHSPWVPRRAQVRGPFESRLALLDVMRSVVQEASGEEQLTLINAHPKLGARGRTRAQLTAASSREQKRAGLDACSDQQYTHLQQINAAYFDKFGFPFILAVRGHDPPSIIAQLERRCRHDRAWELRTALNEIGLIAGYRLAESVSSTAAAEIPAMLARLQVEPEAGQARLVTEWMRTANLSLASGGEHPLIGVAPSSRCDARTLLIGLHYDRVSASLVSDGSQGWTTAIAVAARLRELGVQLPFDLGVFADLHAESVVGPTGTGGGLLPCSRVTLESIDQTMSRNRTTLAALHAAGVTDCAWVIEGELMFMDLERSASALQEFLREIPS